jgi:mannose-6-phosphate isomerase-like protein (cupin superfamily)
MLSDILIMKGDDMETREIMAGYITFIDRDVPVEGILWNAHPKFRGVFLKHLIKGTDTGGMLSCHMVRIDPNAIREDHVHENQWELHEVIEGEGSLILESKEEPYYPGRMGIIPKGVSHKVIAGKNGLVLLAKFFPALL